MIISFIKNIIYTIKIYFYQYRDFATCTSVSQFFQTIVYILSIQCFVYISIFLIGETQSRLLTTILEKSPSYTLLLLLFPLPALIVRRLRDAERSILWLLALLLSSIIFYCFNFLVSIKFNSLLFVSFEIISGLITLALCLLIIMLCFRSK